MEPLRNIGCSTDSMLYAYDFLGVPCLIAVVFAALTTEIDGGDACLHCPRGAVKERVRWQGERCHRS